MEEQRCGDQGQPGSHVTIWELELDSKYCRGPGLEKGTRRMMLWQPRVCQPGQENVVLRSWPSVQAEKTSRVLS